MANETLDRLRREACTCVPDAPVLCPVCTIHGECVRLGLVVDTATVQAMEIQRALVDLEASLKSRIDVVLSRVDECEQLVGSDPTDEEIAAFDAEDDAITAAYVRDRAGQYDESSGIHHALLEVADAIAAGEHRDAYRHGELDDMMRTCLHCSTSFFGTGDLCASCDARANDPAALRS